MPEEARGLLDLGFFTAVTALEDIQGEPSIEDVLCPDHVEIMIRLTEVMKGAAEIAEQKPVEPPPIVIPQLLPAQQELRSRIANLGKTPSTCHLCQKVIGPDGMHICEETISQPAIVKSEGSAP
jgi:hypothetical protein